jgi:hypothetical protein
MTNGVQAFAAYHLAILPGVEWDQLASPEKKWVQ